MQAAPAIPPADRETTFRGQVLRPPDEGYEAARRVFNALIDRRPALIARCTGVADVMAASSTPARTRLHRMGPIVLGGMLQWEREVLPDALHLYREIIDSAPDEFGSAFAFLSAPPEPFVPERLHGRPVVGAIVCHTGEQSAGEETLRPLRNLGPPVVDLVQAMPYTVVQTLLDAGNRPGLQNYWKAEALDELTDEAIEVLADHTAAVPSPISLLVLEAGGRGDRAGGRGRDPDQPPAMRPAATTPSRCGRTPGRRRHTSAGRGSWLKRCSPSPPRESSSTS